MNYSWKRIISGSIAAVLIAWACLAGGALAAVQIAVYEVIGLFLIWNSNDLGDSTFTGLVTSKTPSWLVNIGGWIVLFFPIVIIWFASAR